MELNSKVQAARNAGYTDTQIADYLSSKYQLPVQRARTEGYNDKAIVNYLSTKTIPDQVAPEPTVPPPAAAQPQAPTSPATPEPQPVPQEPAQSSVSPKSSPQPVPAPLAAVYQQYPGLQKYNFQFMDSPQAKGDARKLEFYQPGEEESPFSNKSAPAIQRFDPSMGTADIFGEMLHYLKNVDPVVKQARTSFLDSVSSKQADYWLRGDYENEVKEGIYGKSPPSYQDWLKNQGGDAFFRGYLTGQYPANAYTPQQKELFAKLNDYLKQPAQQTAAQPPPQDLTGRPELDIPEPTVPPAPQQPQESVLPTGKEALGALKGGTQETVGGTESLVANMATPTGGATWSDPNFQLHLLEERNKNLVAQGKLSPQAAQEQLQLATEATQAANQRDVQNKADLAAMNEQGKKLTAAGKQTLEETQPKNPGFIKRNILSVIKGAPSLVAGTAAGVVTRNPLVGAAVMGAGQGGEAYGDVQNSPDLTEEQKQHYALATAGLGTVFNSLPMGAAFKPATSIVRRFLASFAINVPAQEANTIAQHALAEKAKVDQPWDDQQWGQALIDSAIQAGAFSAVHVAGGTVPNKLAEKSAAKAAEKQKAAEDETLNWAKQATEPNPSAQPSERTTTDQSAQPQLTDQSGNAKAAESAPEPSPTGSSETPQSTAPATPAKEQTISQRDLHAAFYTEDGSVDMHQATAAVQRQAQDALDNGMVVIQHSKTGVKKNSFIVDDPSKIDVQSIVDGKSRLRIVAPDSPLIDKITSQKGGEKNGQRQQTDETGQGQQAPLLNPDQTSSAPKAEEVPTKNETPPTPAESPPTVPETFQSTKVDVAAHEAATSPLNDLPHPTPAQAEAGNYQKGHVNLHGLDISIENPRGSVRTSKPGAETPWQSTMQAHYGYLKGTIGKDKDHIDVFVGPHAEDSTKPVFVIDQPKFNGKGFDEHKTLIGFDSKQAALDAYGGSYDKAAQPMVKAASEKITEMSLPEFKDWIANGDHQKPVSAYEPTKTVEQPKSTPTADIAVSAGIPKEQHDIAVDRAAGKTPDQFNNWVRGRYGKAKAAELTKSGQVDRWYEAANAPAKKAETNYQDLNLDKDEALRIAIDKTIARTQNRPDIPEPKRVMVMSTLGRLRKQLESGKITPEKFAKDVAALHRDMLVRHVDRKFSNPPRVRGADYIQERLINAKRHGVLDERGIRFAEWFLKKNPSLFDELGISIKGGSDATKNGSYYPIRRIMEIIASEAQPTTIVHEMLHHLEQLMPLEMQHEIRMEFWRQMENGKQEALKGGDPRKIAFFENATKANLTGDENAQAAMRKALLRGEVPGSFYQYYNPSEFWAVNATLLTSNRYRVRNSIWGKIKQWLKEAIDHIRSFFKLPSHSPLSKALDSLIRGEGLKKTSGKMINDRQKFHYRDIGKGDERVPPEEPPSSTKPAGEPDTWQVPAMRKWDKFLYDWEDKNVDTKNVVKAIEEFNKQQLEDSRDPYLAQELYPKRTAARTKLFLNDELKPLLVDMKSKGVSIPDLETYLHMVHAPERNATIQSRDPTMKNGSGVSTAKAKEYLNSLPADKKADLQALASRVRKIINGTLQTLTGYGLESQATVDLWKSAWPDYVPLQREDFENETSFGIGQGFSVRGSASKQALGSERKVSNILANIALQRERAITRGEKNRVSLALYGLAKSQPNSDFWSTERVPMIRKFDKKLGKIVSYVNPTWKSKENVIVSRYPNEAGRVVERAVVFNERNPVALRMARALKNLDTPQLEGAIGVMSKISRWVSAINTQWNPLFGQRNLRRDLQEALMNMTNSPIRYEKNKVTKYAIQAIPGAWSDVRAERKGKHPNSNWAHWYERAEQAGSFSGYRDLFRTTKEKADAIVKMLESTDQNLTEKSFGAVKNWIDDYNHVCETAVRVAVFRTAVEKGLSDARAASLAANMTINFDKKGAKSAQANALYAFFNARAQGTAIWLRTLAGPAGKRIIAGGLLLGVMQAIALSLAGFNQDDPPEFVKENSLVIPIGKGKYVMWTMPQGGRILVSLGRIPTEHLIYGAQKSKTLSNMMSVLADAFSPLSTTTPLQTATPTAAVPIAALAENKRFTGRPIYKESADPFDQTPGYLRKRDTASLLATGIARSINYLTGGDKYAKNPNFDSDVMSPTPDQIDYLLGYVGGGVSRTILNTQQTVSAAYNHDDIPLYKVPLLGEFYGTTKSSQSKASEFYDLVKLGRYHLLELKGRGKDAGEDAVKQYAAAHPELKQTLMAVKAEQRITEIRGERRKAAAAGASASQLREFDKKMSDIMTKVVDGEDQQQ